MMKAPGRRRAGHDRRQRGGQLRRQRRRHHAAALRRRRGRRRHDRRRRPADAQQRLEADGRGVLRQRRARAHAAGGRGAAPRPPRHRETRRDGHQACSPPPPATGSGLDEQSFLKGIAVGAGLVLLGVLAGRLSARDEHRRPTSPSSRRHAPWSRRVADGRSPPRELLDLHLARIAERNPELNALVSLDEERARAGAAAADEAPARASGRPAARAAVRVQGHPRRRRVAHDVRLAAVRRPRARARRAGRRAHPGRRRRAARQDERAGVRGRLAHVQPGLRHHAQPGRPDPVRRRLQRRRRVRAGRRAWCRSPTAPTWAGRCATRRRSAASSGCGPRSAGCRRGRPTNLWETTVGRRPAGAQRRRPRAAAVGDRRARPAGADRARASRARCSRAPVQRLAGRAPGRAVGPTSAARSRSTREVASVVEASAAVLSQAGAAVSSAWPDLSLGRGHLPHPAGLAVPGTPSASCWPSTPRRSRPSLADNIRAGESLTGADVARAYAQRTALSETDARASSRRTTCWRCRSARCRRSRPTRSSRRRSTAGRWRPTSTGCARRT